MYTLIALTLSVGEGCILMRDIVGSGCIVVLTASDRDEKVARISDGIVFSYVLESMFVSVTEVLKLATEWLILLVREELNLFVMDGLIADREGLEVISANEEESVARRDVGERVNKTISSRNVILSITPAINWLPVFT